MVHIISVAMKGSEVRHLRTTDRRLVIGGLIVTFEITKDDVPKDNAASFSTSFETEMKKAIDDGEVLEDMKEADESGATDNVTIDSDKFDVDVEVVDVTN